MLGELVTRVRRLENDSDSDKSGSGLTRRDIVNLQHIADSLQESTYRLDDLRDVAKLLMAAARRLDQHG